MTGLLIGLAAVVGLALGFMIGSIVGFKQGLDVSVELEDEEEPLWIG